MQVKREIAVKESEATSNSEHSYLVSHQSQMVSGNSNIQTTQSQMELQLLQL